MSELHDPANENPEPGDAHAQQERLKDAFPGETDPKPTKSRWADPDLSLLKTGFDDAVPFPIEVLGPFWQTSVERSARSANAPVDYTAGTLLATVGALLGNVRWPNVEGVWEHPSVLWIGLVGDPATAKSPGLRLVRRLINQIEANRSATIDSEGPAHRLAAVLADLTEKAWRRDVEAARAEDKPLPEWPREAEIPAAPVMPVLHVVDATTESLITTAAGSPRGLLQFSDELAGWFGGFDRYRAKGVRADRPFWLKAYDGDPYTVSRHIPSNSRGQDRFRVVALFHIRDLRPRERHDRHRCDDDHWDDPRASRSDLSFRSACSSERPKGHPRRSESRSHSDWRSRPDVTSWSARHRDQGRSSSERADKTDNSDG